MKEEVEEMFSKAMSQRFAKTLISSVQFTRGAVQKLSRCTTPVRASPGTAQIPMRAEDKLRLVGESVGSPWTRKNRLMVHEEIQHPHGVRGRMFRKPDH